MNNRVKKNCDKLLRQFVFAECAAQKDVPSEVLEYVISQYPNFADLLKGIELKQLDETDFLIQFENFIHQSTYTIRTEFKSKPIEPVDQLATKAYTEMRQKAEVANKISDTYQTVIDQRTKIHNKFEDLVVTECLGMDVWSMKLDLLYSKCMDSLMKEAPSTYESFKKLEKLLKEESLTTGDRLVKLKEMETSYKELETNQDYQKLVVKHKQLMMKKNLLLMAMD